MKTNVALIGFMASGKSAVGRALAARLNRKFVELDDIISERAGKPIPDIFRENGETAFREMEIEAVKEVAKGTDQVIACGGGVVLNWINVERLRPTSRLFYLHASPEAVLARVSREQHQRPLLDVADPAQRVRDLLWFRKSFYQRAADSRVDTSGRTVEQIAGLIVRRLKQDECFNL